MESNVEQRRVTLSNLAEGAAEHLFQEAFAKVLANFEEVDDAKAKRSITLKLSIGHDAEQRTAWIDVECQTKLAQPKPVGQILHLGQHRGRPTALLPFKQEDMFDEPEGKPQPVATPN